MKVSALVSMGAAMMSITPAAAQTYALEGPISDYADIAHSGATAGRNYAWGLRIICPVNKVPVAVTCWIDELSDATLTTNGGYGRAAFCLWRFGPFASGAGRTGRITARCAPSSSVVPPPPSR